MFNNKIIFYFDFTKTKFKFTFSSATLKNTYHIKVKYTVIAAGKLYGIM